MRHLSKEEIAITYGSFWLWGGARICATIVGTMLVGSIKAVIHARKSGVMVDWSLEIPILLFGAAFAIVAYYLERANIKIRQSALERFKLKEKGSSSIEQRTKA